MKHLDVGGPRTNFAQVAACGGYVGLFGIDHPAHSPATKIYQRVTCALCLIAWDRLVESGLAILRPHHASSAKRLKQVWQAEVEVSDRAFPYAPLSCLHRQVRTVARMPRADWRMFNEPVRPETVRPAAVFAIIECVDCGADVTDRMRNTTSTQTSVTVDDWSPEAMFEDMATAAVRMGRESQRPTIFIPAGRSRPPR